MKDVRSAILSLLKSYPDMKRQIEQLRFELAHPAQIGDREIIDSFSFGANNDGIQNVGYISNKTMSIALRYRDTMLKMNSEVFTDIMQELQVLEAKVGRLEYYISMLDEPQAATIRMLYIEKKSWVDIEKEKNLSRSTLSSLRKSALDELVRMYTYIDKVKYKAPDDTG